MFVTCHLSTPRPSGQAHCAGGLPARQLGRRTGWSPTAATLRASSSLSTCLEKFSLCSRSLRSREASATVSSRRASSCKRGTALTSTKPALPRGSLRTALRACRSYLRTRSQIPGPVNGGERHFKVRLEQLLSNTPSLNPNVSQQLGIKLPDGRRTGDTGNWDVCRSQVHPSTGEGHAHVPKQGAAERTPCTSAG